MNRTNYYSDWSVYAQAVNSNFSTLSSSWIVPPAPLSHGPADLSSVYIFNGAFAIIIGIWNGMGWPMVATLDVQAWRMVVGTTEQRA